MNGVVDIKGCVQFLNNEAPYRGGAIFAIDSSLNITGTQKFLQNSAQQSGAMACDNSKLILTEPLTINFIENRAYTDGGVIFHADEASFSMCMLSTVVTTDSLYDKEYCFIELDSAPNIQLNFTGNMAGNAGTLFYGGNLDNCKLYIGGRGGSRL